LLRVPLLQSVIGLFELPADEEVPDDEHFIEIEDTAGNLVETCILFINIRSIFQSMTTNQVNAHELCMTHLTNIYLK